jgi:hypothetical protein
MPNSIEQVSRVRVFVGASFSIGIFLAVRVLFPDFAASAPAVVAAREAMLLALVAALVLYVAAMERLPIAALGWRPRLASLGWGVAICLTLAVASLLTIAAARAIGFEQDARVLSSRERPAIPS